MTFTINCPSCSFELTTPALLFARNTSQKREKIPKNDRSELTRLPIIDHSELLAELGLRSCCVTELISKLDRTLLIYGYDHQKI